MTVFTISTAMRQKMVTGLCSLLLAGCAYAADSYFTLAEQLSRQLETQMPVKVGIGDFVYADSLQQSPFSSLLREELETALASNSAFEVITRDRLADLEIEAGFQQTALSTAQNAAREIKIEGVDGIVRGRFFYKYPDVTIFAELAWLEGGKVQKARVTIPVKNAGADLFPDSLELSPASANERIRPQNFEKSEANVADVTERTKSVPQDFGLKLSVTDGKHDFAEGESISFRVMPQKSCHIAVLVHQNDGSSVLLFPNAHNRNTWVERGQVVQVPGTRKSGFEILIGPPFGADVVQVIACTRKSELHRLLDREVQRQPNATYRGVSRGMFYQGISQSVSAAPVEGFAPPEWASAHLIVSTYPKF